MISQSLLCGRSLYDYDDYALRSRREVTIDWTLRKNIRAQLRARIRRIFRKHGHLS